MMLNFPLVFRRTAAVAVLALNLGACADDPEAFGVLGSALGGALGGVAGSQIGDGVGQLLATAAGGALGAYYGGKLFRQMAEADQDRARQAHYHALERTPSGQSVHWHNPDRTAGGRVSAQPAFSANNDAPCRRYSHTIELEGEQEVESGVACRQADGSWRVVQQD